MDEENKVGIKVDSITLDKLFNDYNLKIPEYQRPYVWTEKQINKLGSSLFSG